MGILAMFFPRKSGRVTTAAAHTPHDPYSDELTIELAKTMQDNCSAAKGLEGLLTRLLDSNQSLQNGVHGFTNAPST